MTDAGPRIINDLVFWMTDGSVFDEDAQSAAELVAMAAGRTIRSGPSSTDIVQGNGKVVYRSYEWTLYSLPRETT